MCRNLEVLIDSRLLITEGRMALSAILPFLLVEPVLRSSRFGPLVLVRGPGPGTSLDGSRTERFSRVYDWFMTGL